MRNPNPLYSHEWNHPGFLPRQSALLPNLMSGELEVENI
jgi:hypothetical protein